MSGPPYLPSTPMLSAARPRTSPVAPPWSPITPERLSAGKLPDRATGMVRTLFEPGFCSSCVHRLEKNIEHRCIRKFPSSACADYTHQKGPCSVVSYSSPVRKASANVHSNFRCLSSFMLRSTMSFSKLVAGKTCPLSSRISGTSRLRGLTGYVQSFLQASLS